MDGILLGAEWLVPEETPDPLDVPGFAEQDLVQARQAEADVQAAQLEQTALLQVIASRLNRPDPPAPVVSATPLLDTTGLVAAFTQALAQLPATPDTTAELQALAKTLEKLDRRVSAGALSGGGAGGGLSVDQLNASLLAKDATLTNGSQATNLGTVGGIAYSPKLVPTVARYQRLRTTIESTTLLYDSFDAALDANLWTTAQTGSCTITQGTGGLTITSGTTNASYAKLSSIPTFIGSVPGFLEVGYAQQFLANPPTGVLRFWGVGTTPVTPTVAAPLTDAYGWLLDVDAKLYAVVYQGGVQVLKTDLSSIQPTDGLYKRYNMQLRTDLAVWYLNSQDVPVAEGTFKFPNIQHLPVLELVVVGPSASGSSVLVNTGIALGDTGRNSTKLSDGTYPHRTATIDATGNQLVTGAITNLYADVIAKTAVCTTFTTSGDHTVATPAAGKKLRLLYVTFMGSSDNTNANEVRVGWGTTGGAISTELYRVYAAGHGTPFESATNQSLIVNTATTEKVLFTAHYVEI